MTKFLHFCSHWRAVYVRLYLLFILRATLCQNSNLLPLNLSWYSMFLLLLSVTKKSISGSPQIILWGIFTIIKKIQKIYVRKIVNCLMWKINDSKILPFINIFITHELSWYPWYNDIIKIKAPCSLKIKNIIHTSY